MNSRADPPTAPCASWHPSLPYTWCGLRAGHEGLHHCESREGQGADWA